MKKLFLSAAALAAAAPAVAQEITLKPLIEGRVRYEHVDQAGLPLDADALTLRARAGVQARAGGLVATVQAQATLAAIDDYYDGLTMPATRPIVADPQNVALYLANLQYKTAPLALTAGRQKLAFDDERFIGNIAFRNNAQTFDAVRAELTPVEGLKLDLAYAWRVNTIWGIDGTGARPRSIGGDNLFANLSYSTPLGTLSGFAYRVDQDEVAVQRYRLSSQTFGVRLAGQQPLSSAAKLSYALSYATQADARRSPNDYRASYYLADMLLDVQGWKLGGGIEVLGADRGVALTSFQVPLGTNFKFQGWADKFLTTPPNGVRDLYASAGYGWERLGPVANVTLSAAYHRFDSDRLSIDYGDEIDLLASGKVGKTTASVRYAHYRAREFATDTDKLWLQFDWAI